MSNARAITLPLVNDLLDKLISLSTILSFTPCSINLAANATDKSSSPSTAHIIAEASTSISIEEGVHEIRFLFRCIGIVKASNPYIIVKLNAVVSYIIEEPFFKVACRSLTRTSLSISASNSNIADTNGASGCLFGIIILPMGITNSFNTSPVCFKAPSTLISLVF